ncbi:hypothetical protein B0J11DRAFT_468244 [Dendryphion nanum]|uniref:Uncharacterized protein n=1 Tax=Dendryphion nanum TaxID=256645 RepID=A0A9P9IFR5_9PLEO|nr:hypothetical protein B0J11DRAFT_468244 [Dendryphion nanum]
MATSGGTGSGEPDMVLVGELLEEISRHPPAIAARKLLTEHYISVGWLDAATENANELKKLAPTDTDIAEFIKILSKQPEPPVPDSQPSASISETPKAMVSRKPVIRKPARAPVQLPGNLDSTKQDLAQGYTALRQKAKFLLVDLLHLQKLQKNNTRGTSKNISRVQAIAEGHKENTATVKAAPPGSARSIARIIQANPEKALELALADLEDMVHWLKEPNGVSSGVDNDTVRAALVKRVQSLESALPDNLKFFPHIALMHIDHENLEKNYVNTETMLGDEVKDIPRETFWVTEDNYAWDMEELVQAITVNGGVMRNPLSRQMFTPKDIKGIVWHPSGKQLAALQVEQEEMSKGVRPETIAQMEKLASVLLEDQSSDTLPSRHAVDEFMAYIATLPELEQKAIDGLRCPAKDSHTGQSYDFSIGESVRDAKGNRVCFHKTGDFIKQAASHLRQNKGAPPDPDAGCKVM